MEKIKIVLKKNKNSTSIRMLTKREKKVICIKYLYLIYNILQLKKNIK